MRAIAALALTCFMLSSVPALAKDDDSADPDKKICRRTKTTGTRMATKPECHTKAEWKAIDDANQASARWYADRRAGRAATSDQ